MNKTKIWIASVALATVLGVLFFNQTSDLELVILHTNDHHGWCWSKKDKGGFAKQLTLVKKVRNSHDNVLLLSGGDINSGAPESDFHDAEPSFKGMNLLGFNAMAIGNHEFDKQLSVLKKQQSWSKFPWLAANIYGPSNEKRLFQPYSIQEIGGLKVAILGLTTEETAHIILYNKDLNFRSPIEEVRALMPELKKQADMIVVVSHLGVHKEHQSWPMTTDQEIAKSFPNISVIVGGHSHTALKKPIKVGKTFVLQAGSQAKFMGQLNLKINKKTKQIVSANYQLHELDETVSEDPQMISFLDPYYKTAQKLFDVVVGKSNQELVGSRKQIRSQETNLGNLITDIFREITSADVAFQNAGGIRATIPSGDVRFKDIQSTFPFGNTIVYMNLTGSELITVLERSASVTRPAGALLQVSGLSYEIENQKLKNLLVHGKPVNPTQVYKVATNNFVATGGDGYEMLKDKTHTNTGYLISNALKDHFTKQPVVSAKVEGRIKITP